MFGLSVHFDCFDVGRLLIANVQIAADPIEGQCVRSTDDSGIQFTEESSLVAATQIHPVQSSIFFIAFESFDPVNGLSFAIEIQFTTGSNFNNSRQTTTASRSAAALVTRWSQSQIDNLRSFH